MTSEQSVKMYRSIEEFEEAFFPASFHPQPERVAERDEDSFGEELALRSLDKFGALLRL